MSEMTDLTWLDDDQRAVMADRWGSSWSEPFATYLQRREDLERLSPDDRAKWLTELLTDRDLGWVTPQQVTRLEVLTSRGNWREWLPAELDAAVSGWTRKGPEELAAWLDATLPALERTHAARGFTWVGPEHGARLDAIRDRGPWRTWLLAELDQQWPGWEGAAVDKKTEWLTGWLPHFEARPAQQAAVPVAEDPRSFGWAADEYGPRLDRLPDARRADLLTTLDEKWPGWERASVADRLTFLKGWLPHFETPAAPAAAVPDLPPEVIAEESMNEDEDPELDKLFDQLVRPLIAQNPEYAQISGPQMREVLHDILQQHAKDN